MSIEAHMIVVHYFEEFFPRPILWLLEEMGLPYEIHRHEGPDTLRALHPLGKSPVISDDGRVVAEQNTIFEYLLRRYPAGDLVPETSSEAWVNYTFWRNYAEALLMPPLLMGGIAQVLPWQTVPFYARPTARAALKRMYSIFIGPEMRRHLDYLEATLENNHWFAGHDFSAADIQMSGPIEHMALQHLVDWTRPNLKAFLRSIHIRPGYIRATTRLNDRVSEDGRLSA